MNGQTEPQPGTGEHIQRVTAQRERFLRFVAARVEDRATAEDILQAAYLRLVERGLTRNAKEKPSAALVADLAAEAIDSLGPKVNAPARPVGKPGRRLRAQELATKTIERIIDPAAPPEEREQRRRRLTKGPSEFRDARLDQPKAKGK